MRVWPRRRRLAPLNDKGAFRRSAPWLSWELSSSFAASHSAAGLRDAIAVLGRATSVVGSVLIETGSGVS